MADRVPGLGNIKESSPGWQQHGELHRKNTSKGKKKRRLSLTWSRGGLQCHESTPGVLVFQNVPERLGGGGKKRGEAVQSRIDTTKKKKRKTNKAPS